MSQITQSAVIELLTTPEDALPPNIRVRRRTVRHVNGRTRAAAQFSIDGEHFVVLAICRDGRCVADWALCRSELAAERVYMRCYRQVRGV